MEKKISQNAPLLAWGLAAAAFVLAAFCLASLTWDGSYYLFRSIQEGVPMIPNHRWMNALLLGPVVWARPLAETPAQLAVLHGLLCALLPLGSLAICLAMLRGAFAPLRFWAACGILLAPLPGQMVFVAEATPALQWSWVCLAFVWRGCPGRWSPAALLAGAVMWGLHPLAAPLFGLVAVTAGALGFAAPGKRVRYGVWAVLFALAAGGKLAETLFFATPYEQASLHGSAWVQEAFTAFLMTPVLAMALALAAPFARPRAARLLWGAAFGLGVIYSLVPGGWGGALCYRKFGLVLAAPLALCAGAEAWRFWRSGVPFPADGGRSLLRPALLFAVVLSGMALSWRATWGSLGTHLAAQPGRVETQADLPRADLSRGLDHWSSTALSLMLQGWSPQKVHVWNAAFQQGAGGFCVCPGDPIVWNDGVFRLAWLARLQLPGAASAAGTPVTTPR
ncbi:MAG: hypothetical protein PHQ12_00870 [Chthoniobacteraceae bacterium]|nr:hypothetical protein [Chthoniobacteraceae bacterium]